MLGAFNNAPTNVEIANIGNQLNLFGSQAPCERLSDSNLKKSDIARYARRSYPDFIVYYPEHWQTMQLEPNTNLALSGEEEELLHSMNFPAFINGRAGSGKSTMLHYAFAYYCDLYLGEVSNSTSTEGFFQAKPLFLTYSERLTEKARDTVERILKSYARYIGTSEQRIAKLDLLKECFQPFQSFLLSCLPLEIVNRLNRSKYISFHEFKKRYDKAFTLQRYSAEVCWHIIRTYIKGYYFVDENQDYLGIEEYQDEIPTEHKKVSDDDFIEIYNKIWRWYSNLCNDEQLWDDQDLARTVLKEIANGRISSARYAAIFCDEAQDFTRVELQLILRLSVWSKYLLPRGVVNSLPFAFAGDPLQTLNPTGFSWTSFRANFYEKILTPLDPDNSRSLRCHDKLALHELRQNYRSPNSVVKFTNFIHLWRRVLFDISNLEPQEPWWTQNSRPPQKGIIDINLLVPELRKLASCGAIFLLPCDEGGELEFLRSSEILKQVFPCEENGQIPPTVYTSISLKGLELSSIVVCFFGEYYSKHFGQASLQSLNTNANLQLEYFINKLYVAVSRSTDYLAIIDTKHGDKLLWQAATPTELAPWLQRMRLTSSQNQQSQLYLERWKQKINPLETYFTMPGANQDNLQTNAKQWLLSGIENNSIRNLNTAIYYYDKDNMSFEVSYCKAWILRIEGQLQEAGCVFMALSALINSELDPQKEAWQCFWEGQCWQKLLDWTAKNPNSPKTAWLPIIRFMLDTEGKTFSPDSISQFSTFLCNQDFWRQQRSDFTWQAVLERYLKTINYFISNQQNIKTQHWKLWSEALEKIALTYSFTAEDIIYLAGQCLYRASYFQQAINLWEQQQRIDHIEYAVAKAETVKPPENLKWLSQANMFTRVVQVWKDNNSPITGWESFLHLVREALKQTQEYSYLLDIEIRTSRWSEAIALYRQQNLGDIEHLKIIARMAHDANLTPEAVKKMESGQRSILSEFVTQAMTLPTWKPTETRILEICVAIEKIGEFVPALQIFEGFIEAQQTPRNVRKFARERWLVVKGKQADFSENTGRNEDANRQRQKRNFFATKWAINLQELSLDVPTLPLSTSTITPIANSGASNINIEQLRQELTSSLTELTESELKQLSHYLHFLRHLRNINSL